MLIRSNPVIRRDRETVRTARLASTDSAGLTGASDPANGSVGTTVGTTFKRYSLVAFSKWPFTFSGRLRY